MNKCSRQLSRLFQAAAWSQLLLLAGLLWLMADPHAHEELHHDADKSAHECAVTWFAQGKLDAASAAPTVIAAPELFSFLPAQRPVTVETTPAHLLPFACGPPCA